MKIGIMGGTFNPIHNAHLMMAQAAYEQYKLDEVWFMPSAKPPHKPNARIVSQEHRKRMIQFAIDKTPYFKFSDCEFKRKGRTYTYDTLVELKEEYKNCKFYFIMGGDSLAQFEQWFQPEKIAKLCTVLAVSRDEVTYAQTEELCLKLNKQWDGDFRPIKMPAISISSCEIRKRIKKKQSIFEFCPDAVVRYIQMHNLYGASSNYVPQSEAEMIDYLSASLRPKRFLHTIGVAHTAACLAMIYDVPLQKARTAGLLHDCAKYLTDKEMLKWCEKYKIELSEDEKATPAVIHGKLGAKLASIRYGVDDEEISSAIAYHTTGKAQMTDLEKIIYIADYIEPNRKMKCKPYTLTLIRKTAYFDLNQAICMILKNTITYLEENDKPIDAMSLEAYHYYFSTK